MKLLNFNGFLRYGGMWCAVWRKRKKTCLFKSPTAYRNAANRIPVYTLKRLFILSNIIQFLPHAKIIDFFSGTTFSRFHWGLLACFRVLHSKTSTFFNNCHVRNVRKMLLERKQGFFRPKRWTIEYGRISKKLLIVWAKFLHHAEHCFFLSFTLAVP